jgi:crossover junction endodeoxyribonuclease RusA
MTWEHIVSFEIPGRPTPKGRPRFGNGRTYTPKTTRDAETRVVDLFELAAPMWEPTIEDVRLTVDAYFKGKRTADLDNIAKLVSDALNGYAFVDDRQVRRLEVNGFEDSEPRVVVALAIWKG